MRKLFLIFPIVLMLLNACGMASTTTIEAPSYTQDLEATVEVQATWLSYLSTRDGARDIEATVDALAAQNAYLSTAIAAQNTRFAPTPFLNTTPTPLAGTGQVEPDSARTIWVYPAGVQTGIPKVDAVIAAVLDKDTDALKEMIRYTTFDCTSADGLGGPPKCEPGETDGTPVQALPIAGAEGHYARPEQIEDTLEFAIRVKGLVAVYRVIKDTYESGWPSGQYAILFLQEREEPLSTITLRIEDGWIVRIDYQFISSSTKETERIEGDFILPPAR